MTKYLAASRNRQTRSPFWRGCGLGMVAMWVCAGSGAQAQGASIPAAPSSTQAAFASPRWMPVARTQGRLTAAQIGLVINRADPYSVQVGAHYAAARQLRPEQVLEVTVPVRSSLSPGEFQHLKSQIDRYFGGATEAIAFAWKQPYAVNCNSITGALALGYDEALCAQPCAPSRRSPYFNAATARPFSEVRVRPSMLLAAPDVAAAKALIQRGVAADHSLGLRGALPVHARYVVTPDKARSSRAVFFPPPGWLRSAGVQVHVDTALALDHPQRVLLYQTGLTHVPQLDQVDWVPGALGDHLTSTGGQLDGSSGQMSVLAWIASGATASYGTVSEPCAHPQKFPHPQLLLLHYLQGSTALEAYWKSVAWPQQGVFVGEPLAAPFARRTLP